MIINPLKYVETTKWKTQSNNEIILEDSIEEKLEKWDIYNFYGRNVPRVSEILKKCLGKDYLVNWAARLGDNYKKESSAVLYIGTQVHNSIEHFLRYGEIKVLEHIYSDQIYFKIKRSLENFVDWYHSMIEKGYSIRIIDIERQITCPWYGGTIDCIMNISHEGYGIHKNYIIDFKTSKSISIDYLLQTFAYLWAIRWNQQNGYTGVEDIPILDGIGIIRVPKDTKQHQEVFLDYEKDMDKLLQLEYAFSSMINWYYQTIVTEDTLRQIRNIRRY